jgi:exopolyphosphatase/guanosine-5'-triphosphate,3'-diphosphate pyrophosphatase
LPRDLEPRPEAARADDVREAPSFAWPRPAGPARNGGGAPVYAALDLGTNNCRLLLAVPERAGFRVVDAFSRIVRLGEGLSATGALSAAAMDRAVGALGVCAEKLRHVPEARRRLVTTEACRAAANGVDFIARVKAETGLDLEIVDRGTEAALAVRGCEPLIDLAASEVVLFDIGGGSTEIAHVARAAQGVEIRGWTSLPVGVVSLAERHGGHDVSPETFAAMVEEVARMIDAYPGRAAMVAATRSAGFHLLGTSGTVTTVAGLHLGLRRYDRRRVDGLWMSDDEVSDIVASLHGLSWRERVDNPCIGHDRADLVLAGCAILEAIRDAFPSPRLRVADRGLREGILVELMRGEHPVGADPSAPGLRPGERRRKRHQRGGGGGAAARGKA